MQDNKKLRHMYDNLSKSYKGMPTFETFCNDMQDDTKRNHLYDKLSHKISGMPSREKFKEDMSLDTPLAPEYSEGAQIGADIFTKTPTKQQPTTPKEEEQQQSVTPADESEDVEESVIQPETTPTPTKSDVPMTEEQKAQMLGNVANIIQQVNETADTSRQDIADMVESSKQSPLRTDRAELSITPKVQNERLQPKYRWGEDGKPQKYYRVPQLVQLEKGEIGINYTDTDNEETAEKMQKSVEDFYNNKDITEEGIREQYGSEEMAEIDKLIAEIESGNKDAIARARKERKGNFTGWFDGNANNGGVLNLSNRGGDGQTFSQKITKLEGEDLAALRTAKQLIDDAKLMIQRADDDEQGEDNLQGFIAGAARGIADKVTDIRTWDFGARDLVSNAAVYNAIEKQDKGETLTDAESKLLNAAAYNMMVNAVFAPRLGRGYKAGEVTAEAVPLMFEMALNPAATVGNAAARKLAKYAIKKYGKDAIKKKAKAWMATKFLTKTIVGGGASGMAMAGTTGALHVGADTYDRAKGDITPGKTIDGRVTFGGVAEGSKQEVRDALKDAFTASAISYWTEAAGGDMLQEFFGKVMGGMFKGVEKGASKMFSKPTLEKVNEFIEGINKNRWISNVRDFEKHTQWHGVLPEYGEEVLDNITNALLVGDTTFSTEKGGVFNLDDNIDTFLGVALLGGFISGAKTVGYRTPKYQQRKDVARLDDAALHVFGNDAARWNKIRNNIVINDGVVTDKLREMVKSKDYTPEEKKAALVYAEAVEKYNGMKQAEEADKPSAEDTEEDTYRRSLRKVYEGGRSTTSSADMNRVYNTLDYYTTHMHQLFDGIEEDKELEFLQSLGEGDEIAGLMSIADGEYSEQQKNTAVEYLNARAQFDGILDGVRDDIEGQREVAYKEIDNTTNKGDGMIHPATLVTDDRQVNIISGDIKMLDDGTGIDYKASSPTIIVRDMESGKLEMIPPTNISDVDVPVTPEDMKREVDAEIEAKFAEKAEEIESGDTSIQVGGTYTYQDPQGGMHNVVINGIDEAQNIARINYDGQEMDMDLAALREGIKTANNTAVQSDIAKNDNGNTEGEEVPTPPTLPTTPAIDDSALKQAEQEGYDSVMNNGKDKLNAANTIEELDGITNIISNDINTYVENGDALHDAHVRGTRRALKELAQAVRDKRQALVGVGGDKSNLTEEFEKFINGISDEISREEQEGYDFMLNLIPSKSSDPVASADSLLDTSLLDEEKDLQKLVDNLSALYKKKLKEYAGDTSDSAIKSIWEFRDDLFDAEKRLARKQGEIRACKEIKKQAEEEAARLAAEQEAAEETPEGEPTTPFDAIKSKFGKVLADESRQGYTDVVALPDGDEISGHYVLIEPDDVAASHDARNNFKKTEGFPTTDDGRTVNDRDYEGDMDAQMAVKSHAQKYNLRAVQEPVIVTKDGIVVSGNDRTMSGQLAAQNNTDAAYLKYITDHANKWGFTTEQILSMQHPRIVFVADTDIPYTTKEFARFNKDQHKGQDSTQSKIKNSKIFKDHPDVLNKIIRLMSKVENLSDVYADSDLCKAIIGILIDNNILTSNEIPVWQKQDGRFSNIGKVHFEDMLIGAVCSEDAIKMLDKQGMGDVRRNIVYSIVPLVKNAGLNEYSIIDEINNAIFALAEIKSFGNVTSDILRQMSMFGEPFVNRYTEAEVLMADFLSETPTAFKNFIKEYNSLVEKETETGSSTDLFGDETFDKDTLIRNLIEQRNGRTEENGKQNLSKLYREAKEQINSNAKSEGAGREESEGTGEQVDNTAASEEAERQAAEAKAEAERKAKEEAEKKAAEEKAKAEAERKAAEEAEKNRELTREEIESCDLDGSIKDGALAYLEGDKNGATKWAYETVKAYVRSKSANSTGNSEGESSSQLGGENNGAIGERDGGSGSNSAEVDSDGNSEDVSSERGSGENSENNVGTSSGEQGNSEVEDGTSTSDSKHTSGGKRTGSRTSGGKGNNVRKPGGRKSGDAVPTANGGRKDFSIDTNKTGDELISEGLSQLKDLFKPKNKLDKNQLNDVTILAAKAIADSIEFAANTFFAVSKIGYGLIKNGVRNFEKWKRSMHEQMDNVLLNVENNDKFKTVEDIDEYIKDMWDYPVTVDGVKHKMKEWASILTQEELRRIAAMSLEEKIKLQKSVENTPTILEDIDNIRQSLPFLLPQQQEDVLRAETQFYNPSHQDEEHGNGKGYLFTNGTGTGKTFTGLGIVKRFIKRGKGRVLIVTVNSEKIGDWVRDAAKLGIKATALENTTSKGSGVVVTQYANLRQNYKLLEDEFDLIVYDESHKIMENQEGAETSAAEMHFKITNRDTEQAIRRMLDNAPVGKELQRAEKEKLAIGKLITKALKGATDIETVTEINKHGGLDGLRQEYINKDVEIQGIRKRLDDEVERELSNADTVKKANEAVKKTKVVFLSASPFNTALNMDYAEGYIFSYPHKGNYNSEDARDRTRSAFIMSKFPSSHIEGKTGKIRRRKEADIDDPESANEEEISFSDYLQNVVQTMSGRMLDSEYDYSRQFPLLDFPQRELFNKAVQELLRGKYSLISPYFSSLLYDYPSMTALFEAIKTDLAISRIKEHIALGRKVVIFHRRVNAKSPLIPPFITGVKAAMASDSQAEKDLATQFYLEFMGLIKWEQTLNLTFPQDQINKAFSTEEERKSYYKKYEEWKEEKEKAEAEGKKFTKKPPRLRAAMVGLFNGNETDKDKNAAVEAFNDDNSEEKVIVIQVQSGKEGISLHDTTGKHQRVMISLELPQSPIEFIQAEGRIYRVGNMSNAIFEYPMLGLDIELASFAKGINGRSQTVENLGLGSKSRGLRESIARAALGRAVIPPSKSQGVGGKILDDKKKQSVSDYDTAIENYNAEEHEPDLGYRDTPTPDPIGFKLVEWARPQNGETVLIPYAGKGTIARYVPTKSRLVALEANVKEYSELEALLGGSGRRVENKSLSDYDRVNKAECVVLKCMGNNVENTVEEMNSALKHTNEGARLVFVVPEAYAERILQGMTNVAATVKLPESAYGGVATRVIVFDRAASSEMRKQITNDRKDLDFTNSKSLEDLFEQLRDVQLPERHIDEEGRIKLRISNAFNKVKNSTFIKGTAKKKDAYIYEQGAELWFDSKKIYMFTKNSMMEGAEIGSRNYSERFAINFKKIAENNIEEIQRLSIAWTFFDRFKDMSDDDIQYIGGVRKEALCEEARILADNMKALLMAALGKTETQIRNLAKGQIENKVEVGPMTFKQFKDAFEGLNSGDVELEELGRKVFDTIGKIESLKFAGSTQSNFSSMATMAHYAPSKNIVEINVDNFNNIRFPESKKAPVLVHELIHAVTYYVMWQYEHKHGAGLNKAQMDACEKIFSIYDTLNKDSSFRDELRRHSKLGDNAEYGLTSAYEMIAELSNPVFRKVLKMKKLWKQLINGIKMILGIKIPNVEAEEVNAFTELSDALDTLMDNYDSKMYNDFVGTSEYRNGDVLNYDTNDGIRKRQGEGEYTDEELSYENDPMAKMGMERSRRQQKEFAKRIRRNMRSKVEELINTLHLDNVDILEDNSTLSGKAGRAKGFFNPKTGRITIILSNNKDLNDVQATLLHEAVAHYGLRQLFGSNFDKFLFNVYKGATAEIRERINRNAAKNGWNISEATEEYLASLAEDTDFEKIDATWWGKIKSMFLDMLHYLGFSSFNEKDVIGDNELRYILWRSYENLKEPGKYRNMFNAAEDVVKQHHLKVGKYAPKSEGLLREMQISNAAEVISRLVGEDATYEQVMSVLSNDEEINRLQEEYHIPSSVFNYWSNYSMFIKGEDFMTSFNEKRADNTIDELAEAERKEQEELAKWNEAMKESDVLYRPGEAMEEYNAKQRHKLPKVEGTKNKFKQLGEKLGMALHDTIESYFDSMLSVKNLQDAIERETGKPIRDFENVYMAENRMRSKNKQDMEYYERQFMTPIEKTIADMKLNKKEREELNDYVMAKHGIERNRVFRERDAKVAADEWERKRLKEINAEYKSKERKADKELDEAKKKYESDIANNVITSVEGETKIKEEQEKRNDAVNEAETERTEAIKGLEAEKKKVKNKYLKKLQKKDYSGLTELTMIKGEGKNTEFDARAQEMVDNFEAEHDTEELWENINKATKHILMIEYQSGIINYDEYTYISNMFENYVPLRGWDNHEAAKVYEYIGNGKIPVVPAVVKAKGRTSKADNVLAYINFMGQSSIIRVNRNNMKKNLLNLALYHPTALAVANRQWYVKTSDNKWEETYFDEDGGDYNTYDEWENHMKTLEEEGKARHSKIGLHTGLHMRKREKGEHYVHVMRNGEQWVVNINGSPRAAQAINGLLNPANTVVSPAVKGIRNFLVWSKNLQSRLFTSLDPVFVAINFVYDTAYSGFAITVKEDKEYKHKFRKNRNAIIGHAISDLIKIGDKNRERKGTFGLLNKMNNEELDDSKEFERYFREFITNGGETGYTIIRSVEEYEKRINDAIKDLQNGKPLPKRSFEKLSKGVEFLNRGTEDMMRFVVFVTSRQMGRSVAHSIFDAKNATVNFDKKGSGENGADWFNNSYVFFNAALQSISNFTKLVKNHPAKFAKAISKFPIMGFALPLASYLAGMASGGDDDDYFNIPKWVRENNIVFGWNGTYISYPLAHELRPFYALGENLFCLMMGKQSIGETFSEMLMAFSSMLPLDFTGNNMNLGVTLTPTVLQPIAQIKENVNYFGSPIYKKNPYNENAPEWTKAYKGTNQTLVELTKRINELGGGNDVKSGGLFFDWNPAWIEHVAESLGGGPVKFVSRLYKTIEPAWNEDAELQTRNIPFASRFVQHADDRTQDSNVKRRYYELIKEFEENRRLMRGYENKLQTNDEDEYNKYEKLLDEMEDDDKFMDQFDNIKAYSSDIKKMQEELKDTYDNKERKEIEREIVDTMKELVDIVGEIKERE